MGTQNINTAVTSSMQSVTTDVSSRPAEVQITDYKILPATDESGETFYKPEYLKWLGFYKQIPEVQAVIDKKAIWTIGKGYKAKEKKDQLEKIRGNGKDTFNSILANLYKVAKICGDSFAEIVKNKRSELKNLKPLNSETIKIYHNSYGLISKYEQVIQGKVATTFKPDEIFHLANNRIGDECHGISSLEKLDKIIKFKNQSQDDLAVIFHRYVKPLLISKVDTDDQTEVNNFKTKLDNAFKNMENIIIPSGTVEEIERVSIPQFSTLDPMPWIRLLQEYFIMAEGIPEVILGYGKETTEATSKILYLAFQQNIEWEQLWLEEQIKAQLGIEIEFEFPASIEPQFTQPTSPSSSFQKARKTSNMEMKNNSVK